MTYVAAYFDKHILLCLQILINLFIIFNLKTNLDNSLIIIFIHQVTRIPSFSTKTKVSRNYETGKAVSCVHVLLQDTTSHVLPRNKTSRRNDSCRLLAVMLPPVFVYSRTPPQTFTFHPSYFYVFPLIFQPLEPSRGFIVNNRLLLR